MRTILYDDRIVAGERRELRLLYCDLPRDACAWKSPYVDAEHAQKSLVDEQGVGGCDSVSHRYWLG